MFSLTHYRALFRNNVTKIPTDIYRDEENKTWLANLGQQIISFADSDSKDNPYLSLFLAKKLLIHHHYLKPRKVLSLYMVVESVNTTDLGITLIGTDQHGDPVYTGLIIIAKILEPSNALVEVIDVDNCSYIMLLPEDLSNQLMPYFFER
jgi:hypothetical protein